MLHTCIIDFIGCWDDHLPLVKFAYNNNYHSNIQTTTYEEIYRAPYRNPTYQTTAGEKPLMGLEIIEKKEAKVKQVCENMQVAQLRQQEYTSKRQNCQSLRLAI